MRLGFIVAIMFFQVVDGKSGEELPLFTANLNNKGSFGEICIFLPDK